MGRALDEGGLRAFYRLGPSLAMRRDIAEFGAALA